MWGKKLICMGLKWMLKQWFHWSPFYAANFSDYNTSVSFSKASLDDVEMQ